MYEDLHVNIHSCIHARPKLEGPRASIQRDWTNYDNRGFRSKRQWGTSEESRVWTLPQERPGEYAHCSERGVCVCVSDKGDHAYSVQMLKLNAKTKIIWRQIFIVPPKNFITMSHRMGISWGAELLISQWTKSLGYFTWGDFFFFCLILVCVFFLMGGES